MRGSFRKFAGLGLAIVLVAVAAGADGGLDLELVARQVLAAVARGLALFLALPPAERVAWGGLVAGAGLGLGVLLERSLRLRRRKIVPREFTGRFMTRLLDGKLDRGKSLDYCELNPSPAARVALGAVRRWGRPVGDLERGVALALRIETDRLRRNVGTLRRVAALSPLLGLLGSLFAIGRALEAAGPATAWGPASSAALAPLTVGVVLSILALIAYDGLAGKIDDLTGALDRIGAETIDVVAASPPEPRHAIGGLVRSPHFREEKAGNLSADDAD